MPRDSNDSRRREIRSRDYSEDRDRDKYSSRKSKSKKSSSSRRYKSPDERSSKTSRRRRRKSSSSETSSSSDSESSGKSEKYHRKRDKAPIKVPSPLPVVIEKKFEIDLFDIPARPEVFEQIDADEFVPKLFAPKKLPESIKIDLASQTILVPKVESAETEEDTLFHKNLFGDDDSVRMDKWVRKLFLYRQKMISSS